MEKKYVFRQSLRNKILITFLLVSIIPSVFFGFYIYSASNRQGVTRLEENSSLNMRKIKELLEGSINGITKSSLDGKSKEKSLNSLPFIEDNFCYSEKELPRNKLYFVSEVLNNSIPCKWVIVLNKNYIENLFKKQPSSKAYYKLIEKKDIIKDEEALQELRKKESDKIIEIFDSNILLYNTVNYGELSSKENQVAQNLIKISLIIIIVGICLSCGISYNFSYGVNNLIEEMKKVREGDFSTIKKIDRDDEISILTNSFRNMTLELNDLINKTYKLRISEKEARFKALQSKISPHFLYNALDSINWALIEKGDFDTSEIIIALSSVLRYSIEGENELVLLKQEIEQVENYLKIQKNRFEDRFNYSIRLDKKVQNFLLPRMIIQPIVENAISHGLENSKNGMLNITCELNEKDISIMVCDTGKGIDSTKLKFITEDINKFEMITEPTDFHIGLANVNHRLKCLYSNKSGLIIESIEGKYTKVTLNICLDGDFNEYFNS